MSRVGVLVATYNGIKFIKEQLDSIINQTYKVDEIVISDDGSSDGTYDFLNKYKNEHSDCNILLIKNEGKHGPAKNFENAYNNSTADILFFADQDDVWKKDKVELFLNAFERYPQCACVFSDAEITDNNLQFNGVTVWDKFFGKGKILDCYDDDKFALLDRNFIVNEIKYGNVITGMCMSVKREVIQGLIPFNDLLLHDEVITAFCAMRSKICCINMTTAYYRQHENNLVGDSGKGSVSVNKNLKSIMKKKEYAKNKLKVMACDYVRSNFLYSLDTNQEYKFLFSIYKIMEKRIEYVKSSKFCALCKFLGLYVRTGYKGFGGRKKLVLDIITVVFLKRSYRIAFLKSNINI